jgi:hypothetical protein
MADLTRTNPYPDASNLVGVRLTGIIAGEALTAGDAVFIHSDGKAYQADAADHKDTLTTDDDNAGTDTTTWDTSKFDGFVVADYAVGEGSVTVWGRNSIITKYAAGMTPGAFYWISGTQGSLSDARIAAYDVAVAKAISATDILVLR